MTTLLRQVTYKPGSACAYPVVRRRVAGPRQISHKCIWDAYAESRVEFEDTQEQVRTILQRRRRCGPTGTTVPMATKKRTRELKNPNPDLISIQLPL